MISPAFQYAVVAASSVPNQYSITPSNTLSFVSMKGTSASAVTSRHSLKSNPVLSLPRTFGILAYCLQYTRAKHNKKKRKLPWIQRLYRPPLNLPEIKQIMQFLPGSRASCTSVH